MIKIIDQLRYGEITNTIDSSKYIEFNDYKSAEEWGRKYYDEWGRQYKENMKIVKEIIKSTSMSGVVECYCGNVFSHINNYLRFGIDNTKNNIYKEMAEILSIILVFAPRIASKIF